MVADTLEAARMMNKAKTESQPKEETPEDEQAVEDTAYFQMRQRIQELLSSLDEQSAKLLTLRFGLEGGVPMTPEQTGKILGMTPEEVARREARQWSEDRKLEAADYALINYGTRQDLEEQCKILMDIWKDQTK